MTNIVIAGVDGTDTATQAAKRAAKIAIAFQSSLHIVSAFGPSEQRILRDGEGGRLVIDLQDKYEQYVADAAKIIEAAFPGLEVSTAVVNDTAANALASEAERLNAELIVVGNKRVQGPARILGSVARNVAANAHCDVYVVNTHPA